MKVVNPLVTFSVLSLMVLLTLLNVKAMALEEQTTVYSPSLLSPPMVEEESLNDIFFDQGEFRLREDAKPVLKDNAQILMQNPDIHIVIEAYCNNREYTTSSNLGQKRAESTKNYLMALGVESNRMSLMTRCSGDSDRERFSRYLNLAWQLNSRVHFTFMEEEWDQGERMSRKLTGGNLTNGGTDGTRLTTLIIGLRKA